MSEIIDRTGQRIGMFTFLEFSHRKGSACYWKCRCDCGTEKIVSVGYLQTRQKHGKPSSCGCLQRKLMSERRFSHGEAASTGKRPSKEYSIWSSAKTRCYNPASPNYINYGAKGIGMCKEWRDSYIAFITYMGRCPKGLTLDRIDSNKGYEPGNVRWATITQQNRNKSNVIWMEYKGEKKTQNDWVKEFGIPSTTFCRQIKKCDYDLELWVKTYGQLATNN